MKPHSLALFAVLIAGCSSIPDPHAPSSLATANISNIILVRPSDKSPEAVVDAIRLYAESKNWLYLGADKVKQGQVTLVKVCIPEVGQQLWAVGLHVSAMLPCGNLGVYQKDGRTEISLLHPRYMEILYPDPAVQKASATAAPLLIVMLNEVAK